MAHNAIASSRDRRSCRMLVLSLAVIPLSVAGCGRKTPHIESTVFEAEMVSPLTIRRGTGEFQGTRFDIAVFSLNVRNKQEQALTFNVGEAIQVQTFPPYLAGPFALLKEHPGPELVTIQPNVVRRLDLQYAVKNTPIGASAKYRMYGGGQVHYGQVQIVIKCNAPLSGEIIVPDNMIRDDRWFRQRVLIKRYGTPPAALLVFGLIVFGAWRILKDPSVESQKGSGPNEDTTQNL